MYLGWLKPVDGGALRSGRERGKSRTVLTVLEVSGNLGTERGMVILRY